MNQVGCASHHSAVYADHIVKFIQRRAIIDLILWLYVLSLLAGAVKLLRRLIVTNDLVRSANPLTLPQSVSISLSRLSEALGVAPVDIYSGAAVQCPATVSWPRPMLLVPANFTLVTEEDAVAAIGHELAHVRRRDFEANLCFEALTLLAFYNPAIHWIKGRIEEAREVVCDEMAADATGGRTAYARSLLSLAEDLVLRSRAADVSLGVLDGNTLEKRIMKLIDMRLPVSSRYRGASVVGSCAVLSALSVGLLMFSVRHSRVPQTTTAASMVPDGVKQIGGAASAPALIYSVEPEFTEKARKAKASGDVLVNLWVDEEGNPRQVRPLRRLGMGLDEKAVEAVKQYRFRPAMEDGKPVSAQLNVAVKFQIF